MVLLLFVLQGLLNSKTLDFFLMHLFPKELGSSSLVSKYQINSQKYQQSLNTTPIKENLQQNTEHQLSQNIEDEETEIIWID